MLLRYIKLHYRHSPQQQPMTSANTVNALGRQSFARLRLHVLTLSMSATDSLKNAGPVTSLTRPPLKQASIIPPLCDFYTSSTSRAISPPT